MPTYDLDLDKELPSPKDSQKKSGWGCALSGWTLFLLVAAALGILGYRTWFYYDKLKTGQLVELPQFQDRFTSVGGKGSLAPTSLERTSVESEAAAANGPDQQTAKLVVVEFADFECPYSKDEAQVVRTMMQRYGDTVRFEYRDYPLEEIHHNAVQAAVAARCAKEQGKFWAYHDKLFVNSPALNNQALIDYATQAGLDPKQFQKCFSDERYRAAVDADRATAQQLGITGTPTFFLNGNRVEGAIPSDVFENLIQKMTK